MCVRVFVKSKHILNIQRGTKKKFQKHKTWLLKNRKLLHFIRMIFFFSALFLRLLLFFDILYSFGFDKIIIEFIHIKLNLYYIYNTFRSCHFQSEIVWLWHLRRTPYKYFQTFNTLYLCVVNVARDCCPIIYLMFAIWNSTNAKSSRNSSSIHNHRSYNIQNNTIFIRSNI